MANLNELLDRVRSTDGGDQTISPERVADAFGIGLSGIADLAGVPCSVVLSAPNSDRIQSVARIMLSVLQAACEIDPDPETAIRWMRNAPIAAFGNKTALDLIRLGKANAVIDYIKSISGGATG